MTIATERSAIAAAIEAGSVWRALTYVPDQVEPPMVVVDFEVGDQLAFGDVGTVPHEYTVTAQAFALRDSSRASQLELDKLRDPSDAASLWQILAESSVGDYARVRRAGRVEVTKVAETDYLTVLFEIEVVV